MNWIDSISTFPNYLKQFLLAFLLALSFGYFFGFKFIVRTTSLTPIGVEENYNGNEEDENAEVMKFKKAENELITTIHTHVLSFSLIFFATGCILLSVPLPSGIKKILLIEPFVSIVVTFGGIWLLWLGYSWMKYIVMLSGMMITVTFVAQMVTIVRALLMKNK